MSSVEIVYRKSVESQKRSRLQKINKEDQLVILQINGCVPKIQKLNERLRERERGKKKLNYKLSFSHNDKNRKNQFQNLRENKTKQ